MGIPANISHSRPPYPHNRRHPDPIRRPSTGETRLLDLHLKAESRSLLVSSCANTLKIDDQGRLLDIGGVVYAKLGAQ